MGSGGVISENLGAAQGGPGIKQAYGKPGAVKPNDLLSFGWSEYTVTTGLLADAQPIDNRLVAFRIASL
jgi:hypothetical protein